MRVSTHQSVETAIARLQLQTWTMADLQNQISSGIRLSRPSQDPGAYIEVRTGQAEVLQTDVYEANIAHSTSILDAGVATLQDVHAIMMRAGVIASEGANASTDDAGYVALANEVDGLLQRLIDAVNSQADGRYLFGGTATDTQPFVVTAMDLNGRPLQVSYQGADERKRELVGPNQTIDTLYAGDQVFQQPGADLFQALMSLRDDLRNPALDLSAKAVAVGQRLGEIQQADAAILQTIGEQSTSLESLQASLNRLADVKLAIQSRTSDLESTDIAEAIVRLNEQQSLFEITLGVTSRLFATSLLDFIR